MREDTLAANIARSFKLLLLCATFCMLCLVMGQVASLRLIGTGSKAHVLAFEPAKQLTASFDHEMLSARLYFNSFVAAQSPGSLARGSAHYRLAETRLHQLNTLIDQNQQLNYLRPSAAQLEEDLAACDVALTSAVSMVQDNKASGPQFQAQLQQWTVLSAAIEKDTDTMETLTFRLSEANTNGIAQWISDGQMSGWLLLSISFFIYYLLMRILRRKLMRQLHREDADSLSIAASVRSVAAPAPNFGAR